MGHTDMMQRTERNEADKERSELFAQAREAVAGAIEAAPSDRQVVINLRIQVNYARGGGAMIDAR